MDTKPSLQDLIGATEAVSLAHESGAQDPHSEARNIVLNQLNFMPRSRKELEAALAKRHIEPDVAKVVLDRFVEIGMVDDVAYAELLIRSRCNTKRVSRSVLRQQLRQKGVD
ncbi:MAG: regulatory protein RecX, partial [Actinobacteria bacterium]|nr:regulatory protein RecX [Actinomycetota bacterium]